jgi:hypothetical protein
MALHKKSLRKVSKQKISPAKQIMGDIFESAQVVVLAIGCIGIVCFFTYAIAMAIIGTVAGPEAGRWGGLALAAIAAIASTYAIVTSKNVEVYLKSLGR